jgi:hypothetical protein
MNILQQTQSILLIDARLFRPEIRMARSEMAWLGAIAAAIASGAGSWDMMMERAAADDSRALPAACTWIYVQARVRSLCA